MSPSIVENYAKKIQKYSSFLPIHRSEDSLSVYLKQTEFRQTFLCKYKPLFDNQSL